jgi:hypothetical protein
MSRRRDETFYPNGVVEDTVTSLGVEILKEDGDELVALCPGHKTRTGKDDGNPSWSINGESGVHFCFSCHYRGNLFTLVRDMKGIDAAKGLKATLEIHGGTLVLEGMEDLEGITVEKPKAGAIRIANFQPESWLDDYVDPPMWARRARGVSLGAVLEYKVRWNESMDAWIFPLRDAENGRLLGYQTKSQKTRFFRNRPRDMKKSHTFFGWSMLDLSVPMTVVIVESPLDALLLADYGVLALAICGSRISDEQVELLQRLDRVVFWLDNDTAGELETKRLQKVTVESGIRAEFIIPADFPTWAEQGWKDPGDMPDDEVSNILDASGL